MWDKPFKLTEFERERIKTELESFGQAYKHITNNPAKYLGSQGQIALSARIAVAINNIERLIAQDTEQADETGQTDVQDA